MFEGIFPKIEINLVAPQEPATVQVLEADFTAN
jgi:hypothetical protein